MQTTLIKMLFIWDVYCTNPQRTCLQQIWCTTNCVWKDTYFISKETLRLLSTLRRREILIRNICRLHSRISFPLWIWKHVVMLYRTFETCWQISNTRKRFFLSAPSFKYLYAFQTVCMFSICISSMTSFSLPSRL